MMSGSINEISPGFEMPLITGTRYVKNWTFRRQVVKRIQKVIWSADILDYNSGG